MDMKEASETVGRMLDEYVFEAKEIESYLRSRGIVRYKSDMVRIMLAAAERRAQFIDLVSRNLLACASRTDEFFELVAVLPEWRGCELEPLRLLYGRDPQTALWLIRRLEATDQDTSIPLSWLYTGAGEKEPGMLLEMIGKRLSPAQKTAWMTAADILYAGQRLPPEAEDFVIHLSKSRTTAVQKCAISFMLGRAQESRRIRDRLCRIAKNGSDEARAALANVHPLKRSGDEFLLKILGLCSKTKNASVRESIALSLVSCAPDHPLECVKILRQWRQDPWFRHRVGRLLEEVGKGDLGKIRRFMESWIRDARGSKTDAGTLPDVLSCVYRKDEMQLMELLEDAGCEDEATQILVVDVLCEFLSGGYKKDRRSVEFCRRAEMVILEIARRRGTNVWPDPELNPFMRVQNLIRQARFPIKTSIADARNNLKRFENLGRIMRPGTLEKMIREVHTLAVWLSNAEPDPEGGAGDRGRPGAMHQEISRAWVSDIDASLRMFGDGQGMSRIRRGLVSRTEFFDALSELTVAARLKKKFPTTLQPRVGSNVLDIESEVGGSRVFFEVFRPKRDIRLPYISGAHTLANAIRPKMAKKIDVQIKSALGSGVPVVLVIDRTDAREIDESDIDASLFGTECFAVPLGEGGAAGPPRPGRKKDSLYDLTAGAGVISAVLLVHMECDHGSKVGIGGKLFRAPNPAVPLNDGAACAIEGALFGAA